jgi:hypothetical protein
MKSKYFCLADCRVTPKEYGDHSQHSVCNTSISIIIKSYVFREVFRTYHSDNALFPTHGQTRDI